MLADWLLVSSLSESRSRDESCAQEAPTAALFPSPDSFLGSGLLSRPSSILLPSALRWAASACSGGSQREKRSQRLEFPSRFTKHSGAAASLLSQLLLTVVPFTSSCQTHTHSHTHTHTHTYSLTRTHSHILSHTHTHTIHMLAHLHSHSHTDTLTHTFTHSHAHTL